MTNKLRLKDVEPISDRIHRQAQDHQDEQYAVFLRQHQEKLHWTYICGNEAFRIRHAVEHQPIIACQRHLEAMATNKSIDWRKLDLTTTQASRSPLITIHDIQSTGWDFKQVSKSPAITPQDIDANLGLPWCYGAMSVNPNITEDFVAKHLDKSWSYTQLSGHPNISFDFIKRHHLRYDNWLVSSNANLTIPDVLRHIKNGHSFDRDGLSLNPNLTWDAIEAIGGIDAANPINWNMYVVAKHIPLTDTVLDANFNALKEGALFNPTLERSMVERHLPAIRTICKHKFWLSKHPNLQYTDLIYMGVFDIDGWSLNPNLTFADISQNPSFKWNWRNVSKHTFPAQASRSTQAAMRQHMAAYTIQTRLCKVVFWNPGYAFCRKRLTGMLTEHV